ncbi:YlbL family protein [Microlunatus sp. Y2014]|uniref:YlbL family protein n=1 Tax=Microlunatus sp. Y2014 TaxID=3418488 RepID=UPI003DA75931
MTRQTGVSVAAAIGFLACVLVLSVVPVPYVVWGPGETTDTLGSNAEGAPQITVSGTPTYPTTGRLDLTSVTVTLVDGRVTFVQALLAWFRPGFDTLDRTLYYPPGTTPERQEQQYTQMMVGSQESAVVAALREAGQPVEVLPRVGGVEVGGPAEGPVLPGDFVTAVDGVPVTTPDEAAAVIGAHDAREQGSGGDLELALLRGDQPMTVRLRPRAGSTPAERLGLTLVAGHRTPVTVRFAIPEELGGPSAGLAFALAIYDKVTPGALLDGQHVAATGTIDVDGRVGAIGGIRSKVVGAEAAGATVFLVPADNCADVAGVETSMQLVRVATLAEAVATVERIDQPNVEVATC